MNYAESLGARAKAAEPAIATAAPRLKNNALAAIADALLARQEEILAANAKDLEAAAETSDALFRRLRGLAEPHPERAPPPGPLPPAPPPGAAR